MESDGSHSGNCIVPVIAAFLLFQKNLIKGLTDGALKGWTAMCFQPARFICVLQCWMGGEMEKNKYIFISGKIHSILPVKKVWLKVGIREKRREM